VAKKPQNTSNDAQPVTTQVTAQMTKLEEEQAAGRAAVARHAARIVPEREPEPVNPIVHLGPVLPVAAKESHFDKGPAAAAIPSG
jgi:hypothetical protein